MKIKGFMKKLNERKIELMNKENCVIEQIAQILILVAKELKNKTNSSIPSGNFSSAFCFKLKTYEKNKCK